MGIGIPHNEVVLAAESIGCLTFSPSFKILGVKVGGIMSRHSSWDEIIAKLTSRQSKWKLKTLSIGGRLTLIKSVLSSLPLYHMSIFKCPMSVLKLLESTRQNFFNGVTNSDRRLALIRWKKVWLLRKMEGLVFQVSLLSIGLFFLNGYGASTPNVLFYGLGLLQGFMVPKVFLIILISLIYAHLGFISSKSSKASLLKLMYPTLFLLELDKQVTVASKLRDTSLVSSLEDDRWTWNLESSGEFSVKSARVFIDDSLLPKANAATGWIKVVTIKINIFACRVCLDKLPMRLNLSLRGFDIPSILYLLCSITTESSSHLLFSCHLARQLMIKVAR
nr:RNA-directed DNA polymerase, eukaryota, reverse transcriptase zinc-binding domain protein [Tanacetum cinerariifolium]